MRIGRMGTYLTVCYILLAVVGINMQLYTVY